MKRKRRQKRKSKNTFAEAERQERNREIQRHKRAEAPNRRLHGWLVITICPVLLIVGALLMWKDQSTRHGQVLTQWNLGFCMFGFGLLPLLNLVFPNLGESNGRRNRGNRRPDSQD